MKRRKYLSRLISGLLSFAMIFTIIQGFPISAKAEELPNPVNGHRDSFSSLSPGKTPENWTGGDWSIVSGTAIDNWGAEWPTVWDRFLKYNSGSKLFTYDKTYYDFDYTTHMQITEDNTSGAIVFRYQDDQNYYYFQLISTDNKAIVGKVVDGKNTVLSEQTTTVQSNRWYNLRVQADGNKIVCKILGDPYYIDVDNMHPGTVVGDITDDTFASGKCGYWASGDGADQYCVFAVSDTAQDRTIENDIFTLTTGSYGQIKSLKLKNEPYDTDFVGNEETHRLEVGPNKWFGEMKFTYTVGGDVEKMTATTGDSEDNRKITVDQAAKKITVEYTAQSQLENGIKDFQVIETYSLIDDYVQFDIEIKNNSGEALTFQDVGLPITWNNHWQFKSPYESYLAAAGNYISYNGSYVLLERGMGGGNKLLFMPDSTTDAKLEYRKFMSKEATFTNPPEEYYIYSDSIKEEGQGYLPSTTLTLNDGESKKLSFQFHKLGEDYTEVGETLYNQNSIDVTVNPGMILPTNVPAQMDIRTKHEINKIESTDPNTKIDLVEEKAGDHHFYNITFDKLGRNDITITYDGDKKSVLQFWIEAPIKEALQQRVDYLMDNLRITDPNDPHCYSFLEINNFTGEIKPGGCGCNNNDYEQMYDGPAFIAEKNVYYPVQDEITAMDQYLVDLVWAKEVIHDGELAGTLSHGCCQGRCWSDNSVAPNYLCSRSFNYPRIYNTFYSMYKVADRYPDMEFRWDKSEYLRVAAMILKVGIPLSGSMGVMGDQTTVDICAALDKEGLSGMADEIRALAKVKADGINHNPYPFGSEFGTDSTAEEGAYFYSKMFGNEAAMEKTVNKAIAWKGKSNVWYWQTTGNRQDNDWWLFQYTVGLHGALLNDWYFNNVDNSSDYWSMIYPFKFAPFVHINSGQPEAPGDVGTVWWNYKSTEPYNWDLGFPYAESGEADISLWAGLQILSSDVVLNDPSFGTTGYGCEVTDGDGIVTVVPQDGLFRRLNVVGSDLQIEMQSDIYSKAVLSDSMDSFTMDLTNLTKTAHSGSFTVKGLPAGKYQLLVDGGVQAYVSVADANEKTSFTYQISDVEEHSLEVKPFGEDRKLKVAIVGDESVMGQGTSNWQEYGIGSQLKKMLGDTEYETEVFTKENASLSDFVAESQTPDDQVLYSTDFTDASEWNVLNDWGQAKVENGAATFNTGSKLILNEKSFTDFVYEMDLTITNANHDGGYTGPLFRATNAQNAINTSDAYGVMLFETADRISLTKFSSSGAPTELVTWPYTVDKEKTYRLKVVANGNNIQVYLDNTLIGEYTDETSAYTSGSIGMINCDGIATFDNVKVTSVPSGSAGGSENILDNCKAFAPDMVVLMAGSKETADWDTASGTFANELGAVVDAYKGIASSPIVYIATVPAVQGEGVGTLTAANAEAAADSIRTVAGEKQTVVLDVYDWTGEAPEMLQQNAYPDNNGARTIASNIYKALTSRSYAYVSAERDPFQPIDAASYDSQFGAVFGEVKKYPSSTNEPFVQLGTNDYIEFDALGLKSGAITSELLVKTAAEGRVELYFDDANGTLIGSAAVPNTSGEWQTLPVELLEAYGTHDVYLKVTEGNVDVKTVKFVQDPNPSYENDFSKDDGRWVNYGGNWSISDGTLKGSGDGKTILSDFVFDNFIYEIDLTIETASNWAGPLFRVTNPGMGLEALNGYCVNFNVGQDRIWLSKHNQNWGIVGDWAYNLEFGKQYHLMIVANGATIQVYIDGEQVGECVDPDPYLEGAVGIRSYGTSIIYDNMSVRGIAEGAPVIYTHPQAVNGYVGQPAEFTVVAEAGGESTEPLTYQWQKSVDRVRWDDITDATESVYRIESLTEENDGTYYRCIVSQGALSTTTNSAELSVNAMPILESIEIFPENSYVKAGETKQFSISVTGQNNPPAGVTWSVEGGSEGTSIDQNGRLTVSEQEVANTVLTVKAVSIFDDSKSAEATVTILENISVAFEPYDTYTTVGAAPVMPDTITGDLGEGRTEEFKVVWDAISPAKYSKAGQFAVAGIVEETGDEVLARIWVLDPASAETADMVLWYRMDEAKGDKFIDWSGNNNTAAVSQGDVNRGNGKFDGSFVFSNNRVEVPQGDNSQHPENITVSYWINRTAEQAGEEVIYWAKNDADYAGNGWYHNLSNGLSFVVDGMNYFHTKASVDELLPVGEWRHVAITFDSTSNEGAIYVNGVKQEVEIEGALDSISVPAGFARSNMGFSCPQFDNGYLNASLDDFRIYSKSMTEEEVSNLYNTEVPSIQYPVLDSLSEENIRLYYEFDGVSGAYVKDYSKNAYDGNISGSITDSNWKNGGFAFKGDNFIQLTGKDLVSSNMTIVYKMMRTQETDPGAVSLFWGKNEADWAGNGIWINSTEANPVFVSTDGFGGRTFGVSDISRSEFYPMNEWVEVAISIDSETGEYAVYRNGKLVTTTEATDGAHITVPTAAYNTIGMSGHSNEYLSGFSMDKYMIFDMSLSERDVQAVYDGKFDVDDPQPQNTPPQPKPNVQYTVIAGQSVSFKAADIATDADGDALTISEISVAPNNAIATAKLTNGTITVTGVAANVTEVKVIVSDGNGGETEITVPVKVTAAADTSKLETLVAAAQMLEKNLDQYEDEGKEEFINALRFAEEILAQTNPSADDISSAFDRLEAAMNLTPIETDVDKSKLEEAIKKAEERSKILAQYADGKEKDQFLLALESAKKIAVSEVDQNTVNQAALSLENALKAMKRAADKTALKELIDQINKLDMNQYTVETVRPLIDALEAAQEIYLDTTLSVDDQKQVDDTLSALKEAFDKLEKKSDSSQPVDPTDPDSSSSGSAEPQTGDHTSMLWIGVAFFVSAIAISLLGIKKKWYQAK